jgi:hypothetical protein
MYAPEASDADGNDDAGDSVQAQAARSPGNGPPSWE